MNDLVTQQEIVFSSFKMNKNGLIPVGSPTFEEWNKCGEFLKNANGAVHFWIGDWLKYGEKTYGETYTQAINETGYAYSTLTNDKYVASRIDPSRRRETLSYGHHAEVADLMPEDQDVLLNLAEDKKLPLKDFRVAVRNYKTKLDLPELSDEQLNSVPSEDFEMAQECVMMLIETTERIEKLNVSQMNVDARDFLLSQVRKTMGKLGKILVGGEVK